MSPVRIDLLTKTARRNRLTILIISVVVGFGLVGIAPSNALVVASMGVDPNATCAQGGVCAIGDIGPGGGTIFYVASSRQTWGHYLEAATSGWSGEKEDPTVNWCPPSKITVSVKVVKGKLVSFSSASSRALTRAAVAVAIGTGRANTVAIERGGTDTVGKLILAYHGGGKNDWFLPSLYELNEMYNHRSIINGLTGGLYWSSSKSGPSDAWSQNFNTLSPYRLGYEYGVINGGDRPSVRPIRSF
jgi:hypothetical protein